MFRLLAVIAVVWVAGCSAAPPERQAIENAADALGGIARVQALAALTIEACDHVIVPAFCDARLRDWAEHSAVSITVRLPCQVSMSAPSRPDAERQRDGRGRSRGGRRRCEGHPSRGWRWRAEPDRGDDA